MTSSILIGDLPNVQHPSSPCGNQAVEVDKTMQGGGP